MPSQDSEADAGNAGDPADITDSRDEEDSADAGAEKEPAQKEEDGDPGTEDRGERPPKPGMPEDGTSEHRNDKTTAAKQDVPDAAAESASSDADGKSKKSGWGKRILSVLLALIIPPVGIYLVWKHLKPSKKVLKIVLTVLLGLLTLGYIGSISDSVHTEQIIAQDSTLDASFEAEGAKIAYPSSWSSNDKGTGYKGESGVAVFVADLGQIGNNVDFVSSYNLAYESQFESMVKAYCSALAQSNIEIDSTSSVQVEPNVMTYTAGCTMPIDGKDYKGKVTIYTDGDGHTDAVWCLAANANEQNSKTIDSIISNVTFTASDFASDPTYDPIVKLNASYSGDTKEGVTLDSSNAGFTVQATYADGTTANLAQGDWSIAEPVTLAAGQVATIHITAGDASTDVTVTCSTITPDQYKSQAQDISYDELLRNPDNYQGQIVHMRGKVMQALSDGFLVQVTEGSYGIWDDIVIVAWDGSPNVIEKDIVNLYGTYAGAYTYTTALGAQKTVPSVVAKYVDIE